MAVECIRTSGVALRSLVKFEAEYTDCTRISAYIYSRRVEILHIYKRLEAR